MKKLSILLFTILLLSMLAGCGKISGQDQIAATTLPVYEFASRLCEGSPLTVTRLVTEEVSCLHDYSLNVRQAKAAEAAETIVISGAGLETFLDDILTDERIIDASQDVALIMPEEHRHDHEEKSGHEGHHHEEDPHIWLSPANAMIMVQNICHGLSAEYPEYEPIFSQNLAPLLEDLSALQQYGADTLANLSCRELITFHDGFSYLAAAFDLTILEAIEEESGSEASAKELIHMIEEVEHHKLPAVFTEKSGSVSAAGIISRETGAEVFSLDMAMAGNSYFDAMYHNINTLKEALQ